MNDWMNPVQKEIHVLPLATAYPAECGVLNSFAQIVEDFQYHVTRWEDLR